MECGWFFLNAWLQGSRFECWGFGVSSCSPTCGEFLHVCCGPLEAFGNVTWLCFLHVKMQQSPRVLVSVWQPCCRILAAIPEYQALCRPLDASCVYLRRSCHSLCYVPLNFSVFRSSVCQSLSFDGVSRYVLKNFHSHLDRATLIRFRQPH